MSKGGTQLRHRWNIMMHYLFAVPTLCLLTSRSISTAFTPASFTKSWSLRKVTNTALFGQETDPQTAKTQGTEVVDTRRSFFGKAVAGVFGVGIVATKVAIAGPSEYIPPAGSMDNKLVVITGGNTGLGLESAKRLAAAGATVVLTSRNPQKGAKAVEAVRTYVREKGVANDRVFTLPLDLGDLDNVKDFPGKLKQSDALKLSPGGIDVLMNNAGVMAIPERQITKDGYERTFQVNHLGHFALTAGLAPFLNPKGSRVINVSSTAHFMVSSSGLDFDNLNSEKSYGPWTSYGASKLENILFTKELQKRAELAGKKIVATTIHPGGVRTDLGRYLVGEERYNALQSGQVEPSPLEKFVEIPLLFFTRSIERGASTQIWLAVTSDSDYGGKYFADIRESQESDAAKDSAAAKQLWKESEKLAGVEFSL